jgi:bacillithiol synthase
LGRAGWTVVSAPIIRTGSLGGSPLSRAAQRGELPQWYREYPRDRDAWATYGRDVAASVSPEWFGVLRDAIAPTGRAAARIERSAGGTGLVVTTGQQPGLFGGPLMSLAKAISARSFADVLQQMLGVPVAPLFWAATDDADFEEASVVSVALDGGPRELRLQQHAPAGTPMARVPIGDDVRALAERLREAAGSAAHASYLDTALHAYRPGGTVGDAYVTLLRAILEPVEIAVLDASHGSVSRAAAPLMLGALQNAEGLAAAVRRRGGDIAARGFRPQVDEVPGMSLVFLNSGGVKRRLSLIDAPSIGALGERQFLSSTVLLRPVVERAILPSVTYVAGPGEIAYFAQVSAVAEALRAPVPLVVPRWSVSVLEPRIQEILDGLHLTPESLTEPHAVEGRVARERLAPEAERALRTLREDAGRDVDALRLANGGLVPETVLDGLQRSLVHRLERVERRFLAGVKQREFRVMHQIATARGALYPHGAPQERRLAHIAFLARYGSSLLDAMLAAAHAHAWSTLADTLPQASARPSTPVGA